MEKMRHNDLNKYVYFQAKGLPAEFIVYIVDNQFNIVP